MQESRLLRLIQSLPDSINPLTIHTSSRGILLTRIPLLEFLDKPVFDEKESNQSRSGKTQKEDRRLIFEGELQEGITTQYAVNDIDFECDEKTWVFGALAFGAKAVVHVVQNNPAKNPYALKIEVKS